MPWLMAAVCAVVDGGCVCRGWWRLCVPWLMAAVCAVVGGGCVCRG